MTSMSINVPHVLISYTHTNILTWQMCSTIILQVLLMSS